MKIYITDFWFILIIKVLRRIMKPKMNEDTEAFWGRVEHAAMMIYMLSSLALGLSIMTFVLLFNENPINRYIAPVFLVLSYVWLFFRHQHKESGCLSRKALMKSTASENGT